MKSKKKQKISIVIPVYNVKKTIERCLDSVCSQAVKFSDEVELIIIDDGSTDGSGTIADYYSDIATVIHQKNKGLSGARNSGIKIAKGEYLYFLDSDDYLISGAVDKMLWCADYYGTDIIQFSYKTLTEGNSVTVITHEFETKKVLSKSHLPKQWSGFPWGKLIKRNLFEKVLFPESLWFEDTVYAMVILPLANSYVQTSIFSQIYYLNPKGISAQSKKNAKVLDHIVVTEKMFKVRESLGVAVDESEVHFLMDQVTSIAFSRFRRLKKNQIHEGYLMCKRVFERYLSDYKRAKFEIIFSSVLFWKIYGMFNLAKSAIHTRWLKMQ